MSRPLTIATSVSAGLHLAGLLGLAGVGTPPEVELEWLEPIDLEFGTTEALSVEQLALDEARQGPETETVASRDQSSTSGADGGLEGSPDAGVSDAGLPDAGSLDVPTDAGDAGAPDSGDAASVAAVASAHRLELPAGAQVALRVNMEAVRASPLRSDIQRFLAGLPDWQLLLDGSGIDPVDDLSRLLLASPDPRDRSRWIIAGRHPHTQGWARAAVERLASTHPSLSPDWRRIGPLTVANWANRDRTARVVAFLDPQTFLICRQQDLQRVIAQARVAAQESNSSVGEALLALAQGAAASVTIEGARNYVRGSFVPERLTGTLAAHGTGARVQATFRYEDEGQAANALSDLGALRDRYQQNLWVQLTGFAPPLRELALTHEGRLVEAQTEIGGRQLRVLLSAVSQQVSEASRGTQTPRASTHEGRPAWASERGAGAPTPEPAPTSSEGAAPPSSEGAAPPSSEGAAPPLERPRPLNDLAP